MSKIKKPADCQPGVLNRLTEQTDNCWDFYQTLYHTHNSDAAILKQKEYLCSSTFASLKENGLITLESDAEELSTAIINMEEENLLHLTKIPVEMYNTFKNKLNYR